MIKLYIVVCWVVLDNVNYKLFIDDNRCFNGIYREFNNNVS